LPSELKSEDLAWYDCYPFYARGTIRASRYAENRRGKVNLGFEAEKWVISDIEEIIRTKYFKHLD